MTTVLEDAIAVFRELGWEGATPAEAEHLPLGTPEQRRTAVAGLAKGEWGEIGQVGRNSYGWVSGIDVDDTMLALFAVRVGVDARRAAAVMPAGAQLDDELAVRILAQRGPAFASRFIGFACTSSARMWEHSASFVAGVVVRLVARLDLPVPENLEYLKDWAVSASGALTGTGDQLIPGKEWIAGNELRSRFVEHARAAVAAGVPATGPFPALLVPAITAGWIDRDEVKDLAFQGLDAAQRPGDRKAWARLIVGGLAVSDEELGARANALVAALSFGDAALVEAFAPGLIRVVDDPTLIDVATAALSASTKQARRLVLRALTARNRPESDALGAIAPVVTELLGDADAGIRRAAAGVLAAWGVDAEPVDPVDSTAAEARGLWRATPPLWTVPRFESPPATPEALTELAGVLSARSDGLEADDLEVERFLDVANAVAHRDPEAARAALRGVTPGWRSGLRPVHAWVRGAPPDLLDRPADRDSEWDRGAVYAPIVAREAGVFQRLGEVPRLLSTPTWVDLRIDPAALVERLAEYARVDALATEADVLLAMTRLDPLRATADVIDALAASGVPVIGQDGRRLTLSAGEALARYAAAPIAEPALELDPRFRSWSLGEPILPAVLDAFPSRLARPDAFSGEVFPQWGDAASIGLTWSGVALRQSVRRATPLGPAAAVNLVAVQRHVSPESRANAGLAVIEAWERGLLTPGVAEVRYLDGRAGDPQSLAAFARVSTDLAEQGLASVVWPMLDALVAVSVAAPRMLAGTAELVEAIASLVPEATEAVAAQLAEQSVLELPGVRALAAKSGASRAVTRAREVVAVLPAATSAPEGPAAAPATASAPPEDFDARWPAGGGSAPAVDDGATVSAAWVDPSDSTRIMAVDLVLPDQPGVRFRIAKAWFYDVENEGQCGAVRLSGDEDPVGARDGRWLRWDAAVGRLVVGEHRDWATGADRPLSDRTAIPPLTASMVAALLASLCNDNSELYSLSGIIQRGLIGSASVTRAVRMLLPHPDVSIARIVRLIEKEPETLPTLWPVLIESIRYAAERNEPLPSWLNRVLDVAVRAAPYLREAAVRGLVPSEAAEWPGLRELESRPRLTPTLRRKIEALLDAPPLLSPFAQTDVRSAL